MRKQVFGNAADSAAPSLTGRRGSEVVVFLSGVKLLALICRKLWADLRSEAALFPAAAILLLLRAFHQTRRDGCRSPFSSPPHIAVQIHHLFPHRHVWQQGLMHLLALLSVARSPILSSPGRCCLLLPHIIPDSQPSISGDGSTRLQARGFHQRYYCCDVS